MKTRLVSLLFAIGLMGCGTFSNPTTLQRVQSAAKVAAYVGATEYLRGHPDSRPKFEEAVAQLAIIESSEHVDMATLLAIVNRLPVKEIKNDRATMIITTATILLSDYAGNLPVEKLDEMKPVAKSIREGLQLALRPTT